MLATNEDRRIEARKSFTVGGFSHASFRGLQPHTLKFPWVASMLTSIIRVLSPGHRFTTITFARTVMTEMCKDGHNEEWSGNLQLPFSEFNMGF